MFRLVKPLPSCNQCGKPTANLKSRVCEECKKERAARAITTDRQLFTAVRALPHMAITKKEGEYRVTFRLASIVEADQGRHDADWGSVAKIVKLEHAWRRLDGRNDDGFQVAPFPG